MFEKDREIKCCEVMGVLHPGVLKTVKRKEFLLFCTVVKKTNHFTQFDELDHQNWNFMMSKMVVSIIL